MQCRYCGQTDLEPHANWPAVKLLINRNTGHPHLCNAMFPNKGQDPAKRIVQVGKWKGWTFKEMEQMIDSQKRKDEERIADLVRLFKSPYL